MDDDLRETYNLLSVQMASGKLYFIVNGLCEASCSYEQMQADARYMFEEHMCPIDFIHVQLICYLGNWDPHGIFHFEESKWNPGGEDASFEYFKTLFPQLGENSRPKPSMLIPYERYDGISGRMVFAIVAVELIIGAAIILVAIFT